MAEGVRGDVLEPSPATVLVDQRLDGPATETLPALTDEELIGGDRRAHLQIGSDGLPRIDVQRQNPELAALPRTNSRLV
jgi:hypothetical protein